MGRFFSLFSTSNRGRKSKVIESELFALQHSPKVKIGSVWVVNPSYVPLHPESSRRLTNKRRAVITEAQSPTVEHSSVFYTQRPLHMRRSSSSAERRVLRKTRTRPHSIRLVEPEPNTYAERRRLPCPHRRHHFSETTPRADFWAIEEENDDGSLGVGHSREIPVVSENFEELPGDTRRRTVRFSDMVVHVIEIRAIEEPDALLDEASPHDTPVI